MTPEKANEMNKERALEIGNDSAFPNQDSNVFFTLRTIYKRMDGNSNYGRFDCSFTIYAAPHFSDRKLRY